MMNRVPSSLNAVDFLSAGLRWLFVLALALAAQGAGPLAPLLFAYGVLALAWGFGLLRPAWARYLRPASVAVDFVFGALVLGLVEGRFQALLWFAALPLLSAGLNLPGYGLGLLALLSFLCYGGLLWLRAPSASAWPAGLGHLAGALAVGAGLGWLLQRARYKLSPNAALSAAPSSHRAGQTDPRTALYRLIHTLSATLSYARVLETALDASLEALRAEDGSERLLVSAVLLVEQEASGEEGLRVVAARRFTPADADRVLAVEKSPVLRRALADERPTLQPSPAQDPELGRIPALHSCQALYLLPLRRGLEAYGLLLFAHPQAEYFTPERGEILQIIANQAIVAIENALLYQRLEEEKERLLKIQEETRRKLARDLHDGPTQSVSALAMRLNLVRRLLERDPEAAAEELRRLEELARRTTREMRHMLFTLRPLVLESQGLIAALEAMAERMAETYHQKVIVEADPATAQGLEAHRQSVIFALVEEAVNNARKHARAEHIWVRLNYAAPELLLLEVVDDGVGFDPAALAETYARRGSLGLIHMRERAELLEGVLQIDSGPNRGTAVRVWIPLTKPAAERLRKGRVA
ncbi:MAG: histidine kinase [Anaerolineales bacterium]|nr:histidine kinase [Anaerolineales bacterium]MDW8162448.1 histidine kinase [Anaerolineales bacterium]